MGRRDLDHSSAGASRVRRVLGVLLVLVVVAAGALVAAGRADPLLDRAETQWDSWFGDAADPRTAPAEVEPPDGLALPEVEAPVAPAAVAGASPVSPAAVRRALAGPLSAKVLGPRVSAVVSGLTGSPAYATGSPAVPASTTKLVTSLAALSVIDPRTTFATRTVLEGGRVVLVGGGDPLLERRPTPGRADLATLARRTAAALTGDGRRSVRLAYDDSLFSGPSWNPAWPATYRGDVIAPITALMVDDGRPVSGYGRVADPSLDAAQAFADALRARGVRVLGAPSQVVLPAAAPAPPPVLASVSSVPVPQLVEQLLQVSDNETAEVLLRQVGVATSGTGSTSAGLAGVREVLSSRDVPLPERQRDGSGLSRENLFDPATLVGVLQAVAGSDDDDPVRALLPGLPVAGFSGSLAYRFDGLPAARVGRVRAKTGTLRGVRSLAGVVVARDGTPMVFALMADRIPGDRDEEAEAVLDRAAAALAGCRCGRAS